MNRDAATLLDIVHAARLINRFTQGVDRTRFKHDKLVQSAVLHQLLVLGEAAKRLSDAFREQHAQIPWSAIARNRDRLIHGYDTVDLDIVWDTATRDVPRLLAQMEPLVPRRDED